MGVFKERLKKRLKRLPVRLKRASIVLSYIRERPHWEQCPARKKDIASKA